MGVWDLRGTPRQNAIVQEALDRCDFPFERLTKQPIPVEWADLSRYAATQEAAGAHSHIHVGDDTAHSVERRERVLGLFWYSGRVTLDLSLEQDPELAAEVLLSEAAHAVDMFYMQPEHRRAVWDALHTGQEGHEHDQAHGWFETPFTEWTGGFE